MTTPAPTPPTVPTVLPHGDHEETNGGILVLAGIAVLVLLVLAVKGLKERFEQHEQDVSDRFTRIERRVFVPTGSVKEPEGNTASEQSVGSADNVDRSSASDNGVSPSGDTDR